MLGSCLDSLQATCMGNAWMEQNPVLDSASGDISLFK